MSTSRKFSDATLIGIFLAILWLPLFDDLLGLDPKAASMEKRILNPLPSLPENLENLKAFPSTFEAFYNDHFGFRNTLIFLNNFVLWSCFRESASNRVLVGKDPWLFYRARRVIDYHRGIHPFNRKELENWRRVLEGRRDWCREKGIEYVVFFAPNKHTIYPEYLPDTVRPVNPTRRLDQLIRYMKAHSDVTIIDVRKDLQYAKNTERLYHWTDSHWNDCGSFLACQALIKQLGKLIPSLKPYRETDFERFTRRVEGRDLAIILGLQDIIYEDNIVCMPKTGWPTHNIITTGLQPSTGKSAEGELPFAVEQDIDGKPDVVVFRDSFFNNLIKYFAPHFRRSVYYWQYDFDVPVLEHEKPDLVIQEFLERELFLYKPENPPELR